MDWLSRPDGKIETAYTILSTTQQEREEKEMKTDFYQRAYDVVEAKLTEALIILQEENGITDGGCDPFVALQYDEAVENMAEAVRLVIENQKMWN